MNNTIQTPPPEVLGSPSGSPSSDCSPKRSARHASCGKPVLGIDFEVFANGEVSMWTHFDHGMPFADAEGHLKAIQTHLAKFIRDRAMCPFHPENASMEAREKQS
jgi:hypothetical protein